MAEEKKGQMTVKEAGEKVRELVQKGKDVEKERGEPPREKK